MINMTNLLIAICLVAGAAILQVFLSTRRSKWPGLILPAIFIMLSVLMILNIGFVGDPGRLAAIIAQTAITSNIPTAILLVIYAICRQKQKRDRELEKMKIRDLK